MNKSNNRDNAVFLSTVLILQIVIAAITFASVFMLADNISGHTSDVLAQQAITISRDKLQDRVDHVINFIEHEREMTLHEVTAIGEFAAHSLSHIQEDEALPHLRELKKQLSEATEFGGALQILHYDLQTQTCTLFANQGVQDVTSEFGGASPEGFIARHPYHTKVDFPHIEIYLFVSQEDMDAITKSAVYDLIHASDYGPDGYVWVNQIVNYQGGDNYAIRLIHPNLKNTEGRYLSTNEADITGGLPYLNELEGIRRDGEIFHTYYFQNKSDGQIAEKASYAKLYEPFDWVIATGDPLTNVLSYSEELETYNQQVVSEMLRNIIILLAIVFLLVGVLIYLSNWKFNQNLQRQMAEKLAENDTIFNIVSQHSDRALCYYDIQTQHTRPWKDEDCDRCPMPHMCLKKISLPEFARSANVLSDSREEVHRMVREIHEGIDYGEANIHLSTPDGTQRWLEFKYSGLLDGEIPVAALLSYQDVTQRHEQELAYRRYVQSMEYDAEGHLLYIESDLTSNHLEKVSGQILPAEARNVQASHSELDKLISNLLFTYVKADEASQYFSRNNLMRLYEAGERQLQSRWQVRFRDGSMHWLDVDITLIEDPYNESIKAFFRMMDVTDDHEKQQAVLHRADYDAMTGLLRRDTGEELIRRHLAMRTKPGGILISLDLDNLKGINDNLGHAYGDKAIIGIAQTMKNHFRKDDILVRAGGDEFLAFLPGAGKAVETVERSLVALLRKLGEISIGENDERRIQCSVGCAVELPDTDTFDSLYQRADMALYHVKRNGKNNVAFFDSAMLEDSYQFKAKQLEDTEKDAPKEHELRELLQVISEQYHSIVLFNLSKDRFRILYGKDYLEDIVSPGQIDAFLKVWQERVSPDERDMLLGSLSRTALLELYDSGQLIKQYFYRVRNEQTFVKTKISVRLYSTASGNVCAYLFFRQLADAENELS